MTVDLDTTLYDSVTIADIPTDAKLVAGYVDGFYATYNTLVTAFPGATHVSITVAGKPGARVADCETGDLTPEQAAGWAADEIRSGRRPTIYANTDTWPSVTRELAKIGVSLGALDWWAAEWDGKGSETDIPEGAVAKQYSSTSTPNLDTSVTNGHWPNEVAPIPEPDPDPEPEIESSGMVAECPTGGTWSVRPNGAVFADDGAPYLGGLNTHPDWKAGTTSAPCVGIAPWHGDGTDAGGNGYVLCVDDPSAARPALYRFPGNGSLKGS